MSIDLSQAPEGAAIGCNDSGLIAYATVLALHRIAVDPGQLRHALGHTRAIDAADLKRNVKPQGEVRAQRARSDFSRPSRMPLPALAYGPPGWIVLPRARRRETWPL